MQASSSSKGKGKERMVVRTKESAASPAKRPRTMETQPFEKRRASVGSRAVSESDGENAKQQGTLYDAVAGRLSKQGFIMGSREPPVPPEQVLFRREGAPIRYEENDPYFAHRSLSAGIKLPDSDLLKIIHAYASDFYGSGAVGDAKDSFQSMDETALIALGVLLEETAAQSLGKTGDLAFVEGERKER